MNGRRCVPLQERQPTSKDLRMDSEQPTALLGRSWRWQGGPQLASTEERVKVAEEAAKEKQTESAADVDLISAPAHSTSSSQLQKCETRASQTAATEDVGARNHLLNSSDTQRLA